jgi:4-amino-4-deoxy-L-arabinose transferase-like glycosyltransferase
MRQSLRFRPESFKLKACLSDPLQNNPFFSDPFFDIDSAGFNILLELHEFIETKMKNLLKYRAVILLIVPLLLYIVPLSVMPLMEPDEARYSDIPSLMNRTGDYVTPRLNHVVYLEKPPLCYWATAAAFRIFGENDFSSRLFVALCAWGCILLVYRMGFFLHDEKTGLFSAAVLTTFLYHALMGRINILDMPLAFFVSLATWAGYRRFASKDAGRGWLYLLYFSSALAFLAKGLIGIVFPFAIVVLWLAFSGRWRDIPRIVSPVGLVILLAVSVPWILLAQKANKDFLWFFFVQEHFLRYTTTMHGRDSIFLYYVPVLILGTLPWSAFLWKAAKEGAVEWAAAFRGDGYRFLLIWGVFIFFFFSLSSSKLIPYVAPVFLPLAVAFGHVFRLHEEKMTGSFAGGGKKFLYMLPVALQSLVFIVVLILPPFLKNMKLGGDLVIMHSEKWWWLVMLPILIQVTILFLPGLVQRSLRKGWFLTVYALSALFLCSLVFPAADFLSPYKSAWPLTRAIQKYVPAGKDVYQYKISLYGIDFYNHLRAPVVEDFGELGYGISLLPWKEKERYFLSADAFHELCKEKGDIFSVTQYKERLESLKRNVSKVDVLWDNGAYYLVRINKTKGEKTTEKDSRNN